MCGIIGYIGEKDSQPILLAGLKSLEYRGYDSSGVSILLDNKKSIAVSKLPGKVRELERLLKNKPLAGKLALGHVRWATHGQPNQLNAHPHLDCTGEIAIVHNGIIENYSQLKNTLIKEGHKFRSQTDTEVIAHLIEKFYKNISLKEAVRKAVFCLEGSFAIGVMSSREPDKIVGARAGSPLVVGVGRGENFLASDISALLDFTKEVVFLDENEIVVLNKKGIAIEDFSRHHIKRSPVHITWDSSQARKQGWPHFMLKEINEQPAVLKGILNQRVPQDRDGLFFEELKITPKELSSLESIIIVACGTAYHAGLCGKYILEELCRIPVSVDLSSEFRYRQPIIPKNALVIAISQSGETADTLAAVKEAKKRGARVLAICNVLGSSLVRASDGVIYTYAGSEIGVASTKAYTAQLAILYLLALHLCSIKNTLDKKAIKDLLAALKKCPALIQRILDRQEYVKAVSLRHAHFGSFLFLGRNINYPAAMEGALKLKEISYIPAEGYAAGEMKHGPLALIDEYRAVVCISPASKVYEKMVSNIQEICSRKGKVIAIVTEEDEKIKALVSEVIYIPRIEEVFSPLLVVVPLQLLAYHIAVKRGCDVDQPRNLAKSVTVE
ncbi:MAG: glutamine--fructose-6-phosphate transaminase (isomerizing) [Candidatus Omnitrophota bacterium]